VSALGLAIRYARRELRSGISGFRIFLAALTAALPAARLVLRQSPAALLREF